MRHESFLALSTKPFPRCVPPAADRVAVALPLFHQIVIEESDGNQSLLNGGVREASARLKLDDVLPRAMRAFEKVMNVCGDMFAGRRFGLNLLGSTEGEVVLEGTSVGIKRGGREAEATLDRQPGAGAGERCNVGIAFPLDIGHEFFLSVTRLI